MSFGKLKQSALYFNERCSVIKGFLKEKNLAQCVDFTDPPIAVQRSLKYKADCFSLPKLIVIASH